MDGEAVAAPPAPPGDGAAWWSLFGALHVNVAVAPVFAFGVMAPSFGRLAGSSPGGTAAIGVAANAGLWLNVVPGYAYDARGPRFATAVGLGLPPATAPSPAAGAWRHATRRSFRAFASRRWRAAAAAGWFAVGHGSAWIYTATLLHNVTNFEVDARGSGRETTIGNATMMSIVQVRRKSVWKGPAERTRSVQTSAETTSIRPSSRGVTFSPDGAFHRSFAAQAGYVAAASAPAASGVAFAQLYDACLFGTVDAAGACAGGWFGGEKLLPSARRAPLPVCKSNLQPDFNMRVFESHWLICTQAAATALNLALAAPAHAAAAAGGRALARRPAPRRRLERSPPASPRRLRRRRGPRGRRGADLGAARARRDRRGPRPALFPRRGGAAAPRSAPRDLPLPDDGEPDDGRGAPPRRRGAARAAEAAGRDGARRAADAGLSSSPSRRRRRRHRDEQQPGRHRGRARALRRGPRGRARRHARPGADDGRDGPLRSGRPPPSDGRAPRLLTGGDALGRVAAGASITRLRVDGAAVLAAGLSSLAAAQALLLAGAAVPGRVETTHWFGT
ncbi:hypothetical protein JL720_9167 [Aureococcus anophagefferens]|nr:hypothetical protein JL720_9167 [Aureococcus anophagefferens]